MTKSLGRFCSLLMGAACVSFTIAGVVYADVPLQSAHYKLSEGTLGNGGLVQSGSSNFQSSEAIGSAAVGDSSSSNFQIESGPKTAQDPTLSFGVTNANANFGNFSADTTATATSQFYVSDYTSFGYVVQIIGNPPSYGGHTITPMGTDADGGPQSSQVGTDQFGINLVANTSPKVLGANPDQGQFGKGVAATNYNTSDVYRYVDSDIVAKGLESSGKTIFTISYVVNVDHLDPGGQYTSHQSLICTGTF